MRSVGIMRAKALTLAIGVVVLAWASIGSASAMAAGGPIWNMMAASTPTNLPPARDEVQEVTSNATGGVLELQVPQSLVTGFGSEITKRVQVPYNAQASEL